MNMMQKQKKEDNRKRGIYLLDFAAVSLWIT